MSRNSLDCAQFLADLPAALLGMPGHLMTQRQKYLSSALTWVERVLVRPMAISLINLDISRYAGRYEHVFETTTAGVTIQSPQLDINTVAAGGGSRLFWRNGLFIVGPESAGAHPGPACYRYSASTYARLIIRKGGPLTVTDANLFLGRLLPEFFPQIFGETEDEPLDAAITKIHFTAMTDEINRDREHKMTPEEVAYGFIKVANESMTRPIRALTEARGYDASKHRLATFGGAGGQHSCAIAEALGISQVLIHRYSSVLSAYGMALADVVHEVQEPASIIFSSRTGKDLETRLEQLQKTAIDELLKDGFEKDNIKQELYLNMRYNGTDTSLMTLKPENDWDFGKAFVELHQREFGFTLHDRDIHIDDIRVRAIGQSVSDSSKTVDQQLKEVDTKTVEASKRHSTHKVYFEGGHLETDIYVLDKLDVGDKIHGPAIIIDETQTIVVAPNCTAVILNTHVIINVGRGMGMHKTVNAENVDPIVLSILSHRFMAIAEQMGRALQKTSVSTNVKERLDYSCALFDAGGGLVANAPHLPVHLGSMSTAVKRQSEIWDGRLKPGDVIVTNHPQTGGTHLPDITVITPAFNGDKIVFYVASRAHHADIGGISPGSMPPDSRELYQEGAAIKSEKLVSEGQFDENKIAFLLLEEPARHPGCSGTRCLRDNINDLVKRMAMFTLILESASCCQSKRNLVNLDID